MTAERLWVPSSGRPGRGSAGRLTRLATRQPPPGPSRPPGPPTHVARPRGDAPLTAVAEDAEARPSRGPERRTARFQQQERDRISCYVRAPKLHTSTGRVQHAPPSSSYSAPTSPPGGGGERTRLPGSGLVREERSAGIAKKIGVRELQDLKASAMSF